MERFFPEDFTPRANYPAATEASLPEWWPISYQDLAPYYAAAEQFYRVRGGAVPLPGLAHALADSVGTAVVAGIEGRRGGKKDAICQ